ncbi:hypothetical protein RO21_08880 [[Actinobacillus] muris]|uniref:Uncharacterized protein n=2 Tax=Muribacter muris TaxID=67855 RepID=A0A0J5P3E0_9PAST|nr:MULTISPECIES: hypothetical protein [Pasteurellaceae]KMK50998.1 hypothetical protein RO21_08880 [[Actinobacillus] muris] [Muribacter muris]MCR1837828.1 hypothetical protein [Pasteurella caecimuris]MCX2960149.1 hypothetical protein [Rodentibacter heylii]
MATIVWSIFYSFGILWGFSDIIGRIESLRNEKEKQYLLNMKATVYQTSLLSKQKRKAFEKRKDFILTELENRTYRSM